jgi:cation:H+ antiporter
MLPIIFWIIILIISLFLLVKASDFFIDSAETIGIKIGLPAFVIGLIIVSLGTSLPELMSSILAVLKNTSEIVIGTIIGSNIANIFLVFGIMAIVSRRMKINYDILNVDLPLFFAATFLLALIIYNLKVSVLETILCLLFLFIYIFYTIKSKTFNKDKEINKEFKDVYYKNKKDKHLLPVILIFIFSCFLIYISAKYTVDSIINLSVILNIGAEVIALSAVAIGTSLPELSVSLRALNKGKKEIAVGNILGSTIFNSVGVLGISSLFGVLIIPKMIISFALPIMLIGVLLYFFITQDKKVTYVEGWVLIIFYVLFIGFLLNII